MTRPGDPTPVAELLEHYRALVLNCELLGVTETRVQVYRLSALLDALDSARAEAAGSAEWREKCQILRSGLNEVLRKSPDCEGAEYARRTLAETSDVG